jgi:Restriction endonuclease
MRDKKTPEQRQFYSSYEWTMKSREHRQHEPLCRECKARGKVIPGTLVDHIIPIENGGDRWDDRNLQTLCDPCHNRKRQLESMTNKEGGTLITIISGLPGVGKTTYVLEHMQPGDLVVDMDALYAALSFRSGETPKSLLPFVAAARDAVIQRLQRSSDVRHAWIITTNEQQALILTRQLKAIHIPITIDERERQRRIETRVNPFDINAMQTGGTKKL